MTSDASNALHLPDIHIKGFRGINELRIPKLGRVTLLGGKNGAGKTSVLEAVQVYAARGRSNSLTNVLAKHEEFLVSADEDGDKVLVPDPLALFYNREAALGYSIEIGSLRYSSVEKLNISWVTQSGENQLFKNNGSDDRISDPSGLVMKVSFGGVEQIIPWVLSQENKHSRRRDFRPFRDLTVIEDMADLPEVLECVSLGPGLITTNDIEDLWESIEFTEYEDRAIEALQLALSEDVEGIGLHRGDKPGDLPFYRSQSRRVVAKLAGHDRVVPLRSLGDGAHRLFGIALALAASRDGFILIDEVENGIHHTLQNDFWRIVFKMATENNLQIFATTHGTDSFRGFSKAANEFEEEGVYIRLEREESRIRAVIYPENEAKIVAEEITPLIEFR